MSERQEKNGAASNGTGREDDAADDLAALFPNPEEIVVPRASDLPDPPKARYKRPNLRRDTDPLPEGQDSVLATVAQRSGSLRSMGAASTIGISLVASIGAGTGLGWLVDKFLLHSTQMPWGLICGFMLGVFSGFVNLVRVANQLNRDAK